MSTPILIDVPGFPYKSYPEGWYQVGWSGEFAAATASPRTFFGTELAIYRGDSGRIYVTDAYCPHMGAHLGYAGVEGECLRCPFHAWLWDANGNVTEILYSERLNSSRRLRHWPAREKNGMVFVWYHPYGDPPSWPDPIPAVPGAETDKLYPVYPHACHVEELRMQPQFATENIADAHHNGAVHRWAGTPRLSDFDIDGHIFTTKNKGEIRTRRGLVPQTVTAKAYGIPIIFTQHELDLGDSGDVATEFAAVCVTPTQGLNSKLFVTSWIPRTLGDTGDEPTGRAKAMVHGTHSEVFVSDGTIWKHMRYESKPPWAREEAKVMSALRNWCQQYYPAG
ncbi:Rieske 2Fe-2S domain-containing protein [Mycolicibacterium sp.]|uniref:Rieske 2Fe-2S domain-containing protein n=1 Tax=Mycolicibacterium sp. TaxID=2320850 RepID=UPI003D1379D9